MKHPPLLAGLFCLLLPIAAVAQDSPVPSAQQTEQIQKIIRDYLKQHPEIVVQALKDYQQQQDAKKAEALKATIAAEQSHLYADPDTPIGANPTGDVSVVEFFDYRCPYCKAMAGDLAKTLAADGRVRLVYKEFPILGPASVVASRAALAARAQDKYVAFHDRLLDFKGTLDEAQIYSIAADAGLDVAKLKKDMAKPEIMAAIQRNYDLAEKLDIQGTPAFVIGDQLLDGAASADELTAAIKHARGS
jgi:protein-disulfide isomerase